MRESTHADGHDAEDNARGLGRAILRERRAPEGPQLITTQLLADGDRATFVQVKAQARWIRPQDWFITSIVFYPCTMRHNAERSEMTLWLDGEGKSFRCTKELSLIGAAHAVLVVDLAAYDESVECANDMVWSPPARQPIELLVCRNEEPGSWETYSFARTPGAEEVAVENDCAGHGGGIRLLGADGGVAPGYSGN